ncbi:type VI secretion system Vgr family protein [Longitalea arenae]|uniref:type VI secretion system Vgr family protein n=1 Tax=Longitalea arenae TaxID=2812558 RepID=UPI00196888D5|nr:type VI secretion system Vgr family protein [Longitalea arenae]
MARTIETIININGVIIKDQSALRISQRIYEHHTFSFICPLEGTDKTVNDLLKEPQQLLGVPIHIKAVLANESPQIMFSGVITEVEEASNNEHPSNLIIKGYSPTILLDNGRHCKAFSRGSIKSIFSEMLENYQSAGYSSYINPSNSETFHYQVQYNETDWQFIKRLASNWGEWLYYDGQRLVVSADKGKKVKLTYKEHLFKFGLQMQLKPAGYSVKAYSYVAGKVFNSDMQTQAIVNRNELQANVSVLSEQFFGSPKETWYNRFVKNLKQVNDYRDNQAAIQQSDMVLFTGSSDLPAFQTGDIIEIDTGVKKGEDQPNSEYRIMSIEHCWDDAGNYFNEFVAVPLTENGPPFRPIPEPYCEAQPAIVVTNYDQEGLGRIAVRFHWMEEKDKTPLLRVVLPYAGNGNGFFVMPEIGDEVMVAFVGGQASQPYVIGAVYNANAKTPFGNEGNDVKAIQSRSGIQVIMNDEQGSIVLQDKQANSVHLNGQGVIKVKAKENIMLEVGDTKFELSKDSIRISSSEIKLEARDELKITSAASANINAAKNMDIKGAKINLN